MARTQGTREQTRRYDSLGRRTGQRSFSPDLPEQTIFERAFNYTGRGELSDVSDTLRGNTIYGYDEEGRFLRHYEAVRTTVTGGSGTTLRITCCRMMTFLPCR